MKPKLRSAVAAGALSLLLLALAYPTLRWLVSEWLTNDYYSHGWLILPVSAFLAWRLWPKEQRQPANLGLIPLVLGLMGYLVALLYKAYFLGALALIVMLAGLVWFFLGGQALKRIGFPLGFLVAMVPLPFVESASLPLQLLTGTCSTATARAIGVDATIRGAQITLPGVDLVVGAQCSGLRSIVSLFTIVALLVFLLEVTWWGRLLLAVSSVPIAILGNILRVASLLWVADTWGAKVALSYYHDYSGFFFFLVALALLFIMSRVLRCREIRADIF